jgi:endonuclease YncB( thermonuclease family)
MGLTEYRRYSDNKEKQQRDTFVDSKIQDFDQHKTNDAAQKMILSGQIANLDTKATQATSRIATVSGRLENHINDPKVHSLKPAIQPPKVEIPHFDKPEKKEKKHHMRGEPKVDGKSGQRGGSAQKPPKSPLNPQGAQEGSKGKGREFIQGPIFEPLFTPERQTKDIQIPKIDTPERKHTPPKGGGKVEIKGSIPVPEIKTPTKEGKGPDLAALNNQEPSNPNQNKK